MDTDFIKTHREWECTSELYGIAQERVDEKFGWLFNLLPSLSDWETVRSELVRGTIAKIENMLAIEYMQTHGKGEYSHTTSNLRDVVTTFIHKNQIKEKVMEGQVKAGGQIFQELNNLDKQIENLVSIVDSVEKKFYAVILPDKQETRKEEGLPAPDNASEVLGRISNINIRLQRIGVSLESLIGRAQT